MENMGIMLKYGKIWILKTILETLKQDKNMFFVHFTVRNSGKKYGFPYNWHPYSSIFHENQ